MFKHKCANCDQIATCGKYCQKHFEDRLYSYRENKQDSESSEETTQAISNRYLRKEKTAYWTLFYRKMSKFIKSWKKKLI